METKKPIHCLKKAVSLLVVLLILQTVQVYTADLQNLKRDRVVPDVIDEVPKAEIMVTYPGAKVQQGNKISPAKTVNRPKISYETKYGKNYTFIMVDPDAPSRADPQLRELLHRLEVNIPGNQVGKGDILAPYLTPTPPAGSGYHRYVFTLWEQNGTVTSGFDLNVVGRNKFSARDFARKHNLKLVAANFFQAKSVS